MAPVQGFARFCQLTLIVINIIAMVKSVELTCMGAIFLVLDPVFVLLLSTLTLTSSDLQTEVKGTHVLHIVAVFFLVTGPIMFVVGIAGVTGAYRKCNGWLATYLGLLVALITTVMTLCAYGLPKPLVDPSHEWRPLSDFLLTSVVFSLAVQGVMIFFTIVLMSSSGSNEGQIHPDQKDSPDPSRFRKNRAQPRPYRR